MTAAVRFVERQVARVGGHQDRRVAHRFCQTELIEDVGVLAGAHGDDDVCLRDGLADLVDDDAALEDAVSAPETCTGLLGRLLNGLLNATEDFGPLSAGRFWAERREQKGDRQRPRRDRL